MTGANVSKQISVHDVQYNTHGISCKKSMAKTIPSNAPKIGKYKHERTHAHRCTHSNMPYVRQPTRTYTTLRTHTHVHP
jgi:hypothetical protein